LSDHTLTLIIAFTSTWFPPQTWAHCQQILMGVSCHLLVLALKGFKQLALTWKRERLEELLDFFAIPTYMVLGVQFLVL